LHREIAAHHQSREELRTSEERFQLVARATNDAVWDWNISSNVLWFSEGFKIFGYRIQEVEPTFDFWFERVHPEDQQVVKASLEGVLLSSENHWCDEYRFRRTNGFQN